MQRFPSLIRRDTIRLLTLACGGMLVVGLAFVVALDLGLGSQTQSWRRQTLEIAARDTAMLVAQHVRTAKGLAESVADRRVVRQAISEAHDGRGLDEAIRASLVDDFRLLLREQPTIAAIALFEGRRLPAAWAGDQALTDPEEPVEVRSSGGPPTLVVEAAIDGALGMHVVIAYRLDAVARQLDAEDAHDHLVRRIEDRDGVDLWARSRRSDDETRVSLTDAPIMVAIGIDPAVEARGRFARVALFVITLAGLVASSVVGLWLLLQPIIRRINLQSEVIWRSHGQLDALAQELARSNAELEQFAFFASHDLQEPLRQIRSFLGLLERTAAETLTDKQRGYLTHAMDGAGRLHGMITGLLQYARVDRGEDHRRLVGLRSVAEDACRAAAARASDAGGSVRIGELGAAFVDPDQIAHVLQNLVENAIKYRAPERPPIIAIDARAISRDRIEVAIVDNGRGIEAKDHERVFRLFERAADHSIAGFGLGLALCRKLVERNRGRIWIEDNPTGGTIVRFTLPTTATSGDAAPRDGAASPAARARSDEAKAL